MLDTTLRPLREARGWSQYELARRAGLDNSTISLLESGDRNPSLDTLLKLAEVLGVGPDALLVNPPPDGISKNGSDDGLRERH